MMARRQFLTCISMMSNQITRLRVFRVKLAVNRDTQEAIAVKIIDLEKAAEKDCYDNVRKEVSDMIYLNDNLPLLNSNFEIDADRAQIEAFVSFIRALNMRHCFKVMS